MSEILISLTGHDKNVHAFLVLFGYSPVFLELCSTQLTLQCPKCLFHMNKNKNMVRNVIFLGKIPRWNGTWKNIYGQSATFLLVSSWGYQDFRHILQNPKVPNNKSSDQPHGLQ